MAQVVEPVPARMTTRRVVVATLTVAAVALSFWLLYRFRGLLFILFIAMVIGTATRPAAERLQQRGLSRGLSAAVVYLALLAGLVAFLWLLVPLLADQGANLASAVPELYQDFRHSMLDHPNLLIWRLGVALPSELPMLLPGAPTGDATAETTDAATGTTATIGTVAESLFSIVVLFLLAFYWTLDGARTLRSLLLLGSQTQRDTGRDLIAAMEARVGGYVTGQALLMLIVGTMALVAYLIIGLPYALVLAIIAAIMEAVPLVGPGLGAIPAALVAFSDNPIKVVWVLVATLIIQNIENGVLVPRIMGRAVGVNPFVTLLALFAFGTLLGVPGALMAIPLAAIVQILLEHFLFNANNPDQETPAGRDYASVLRYELQELTQDVRRHTRQHPGAFAEGKMEQMEDELEAIATDLDSLLAQVSPSEAEV